MGKLTQFLLTGALFWVGAGQAAPITIGSLTYEGNGSEVIRDSLNDMEWLRWDVLAPLTYRQTVAATNRGGTYEGWSIATEFQAQQFTDALLSDVTNDCEITGNAFCYKSDSFVDFGSLVGDSFHRDLPFWQINQAWFLSHTRPGHELGIITLHSMGQPGGECRQGIIHSDPYCYVGKLNHWWGIGKTDNWSSEGYISDSPISWLLYRESGAGPAAIPNPGTLALLGLGLGAMGIRKGRGRRGLGRDTSNA